VSFSHADAELGTIREGQANMATTSFTSVRTEADLTRDVNPVLPIMFALLG
jgi:hypothetical protein